VARGFGTWRAERRCRDAEPGSNDTVTINIEE
jgi:hypothetical protein